MTNRGGAPCSTEVVIIILYHYWGIITLYPQAFPDDDTRVINYVCDGPWLMIAGDRNDGSSQNMKVLTGIAEAGEGGRGGEKARDQRVNGFRWKM